MSAVTPDLLRRYREPHRRYHDLRHVEHCLAELAAVDGLAATERERLTQAIWFHDAIYDPARSDNEERSARLAESTLPDPAGAEVARLVRLTAGHRVEPDDRLGAILVSIDLAILGADPEAYEVYVQGIRQEYGHVPDEAFALGRAAFLKRMLATDAIYPDPGFAARFEARARRNLSRELSSLEPGA